MERDRKPVYYGYPDGAQFPQVRIFYHSLRKLQPSPKDAMEDLFTQQKIVHTLQPPYWNYRDQPSYLTDERHGARQSVEGGSQSSYETGYTAGGLRSYAAEAYSAGKFTH